METDHLEIKIPIPRGGYQGLIIKIKTDLQDPLNEADSFQEAAEFDGWYGQQCLSDQGAIILIKGYLDGVFKRHQ